MSPSPQEGLDEWMHPWWVVLQKGITKLGDHQFYSKPALHLWEVYLIHQGYLVLTQSWERSQENSSPGLEFLAYPARCTGPVEDCSPKYHQGFRLKMAETQLKLTSNRIKEGRMKKNLFIDSQNSFLTSSPSSSTTASSSFSSSSCFSSWNLNSLQL